MVTETKIKLRTGTSPGFTKIEEPTDIAKFIARAISEEARVEVQLTETAYRFSSRIHHDSDPTVGLRVRRPEGITNEQVEAQTKFQTQTSMVVAFLKSHELLCIQTDGAFWKEGELLIPQPWTAFKLQRRKEPRYEIPGAYEFYIALRSLEDPKVSIRRRVMDLSMSGMGFYVESPTESELYKKGLFLRRVNLMLENRHIFLDLRVASCVRLKHNPRMPGFKVGVEVMRISPVDKRYVAAYIARGLAQSGQFG
ncbi:unnamed protein product [Sphagnum jensenii]|uniref:PilZ domain-containing protein n=1 Tax=Sphagnum jensenii TaxID=128206 RepID=A0ABP0VFF4_9BRYO